MKSFRFALLVATSALVFAAAPAFAKSGWLTDFNKAKEEAKGSNKLLLIDFTGSDWCGYCIKLDREVFSTPEFQDYASKNLILFVADFPKRKEIPAELEMQNQRLAMQFGIQGFPTIVVLDATGKKVGELGYMPGGPSAFLAELDKLRKG